MTQAFAGVRVLDFSQVLAGPYATQLLGLLGAEVIKIETPGDGDLMRSMMAGLEPRQPLMSPGFMTVNIGKKSLTLDLKAAAAKEIIARLVRQSDAVVENFRAGVIDKLGFGYGALSQIRPDIVYCSMSGFGQQGPEAGRPAYDGAIQAASGMMMNNGHPETGPTRAGYMAVDMSTGITAAFAIAAALYRRQVTGEGQYLDVSMLDAAISLQASAFARYHLDGELPALLGNDSPAKVPTAGVFATADGQLLISAVNETQAQNLIRTLGLAAMLEDPAYVDNAARSRNLATALVEIRRAFATRSSAHWIARLAAAKVPAALIRNIDEVAADPQLNFRNILPEMPAPGEPDRTVKLVGAAFVADQDGPAPQGPPPRVGEHSDEILSGLGYSTAEIAEFRDQGVI